MQVVVKGFKLPLSAGCRSPQRSVQRHVPRSPLDRLQQPPIDRFLVLRNKKTEISHFALTFGPYRVTLVSGGNDLRCATL